MNVPLPYDWTIRERDKEKRHFIYRACKYQAIYRDMCLFKELDAYSCTLKTLQRASRLIKFQLQDSLRGKIQTGVAIKFMCSLIN